MHHAHCVVCVASPIDRVALLIALFDCVGCIVSSRDHVVAVVVLLSVAARDSFSP